MPEPSSAEAALIAEQLRHTVDLLRTEIEQLRQVLEHDRELASLRLKALEEGSRDHESRIRAATDGVTQFKVWSGLASGGSAVMSLIAFVKAFLGV